ncbi:complex III assembly factor LYRM7 [Choristoneura fumiferana]|uniref:complex III assembly factor LYRM7 n=1 Tax=Choristoneura fumiferana TaxID=7141 RepID=UPI003D15AD80
MNRLKRNVLQCFKKLHRTRLKVFEGDEKALTAGRLRINEEFKKNKDVQNEEAIKAMLAFGEDVEKELRTQVIQAKEVKPGVFEARITEDTVKIVNLPFNDSVILEKGTGTPCCKDVKK